MRARVRRTRGSFARGVAWGLAIAMAGSARAGIAQGQEEASSPRAIVLVADPDLRDTVESVLLEWGYRVMRPRAAAPARACTQVSCAAAEIQAGAAQFAVAATLWRREPGPTVSLTLVDPRDARFPATVRVESTVAAALEDALTEAMTRRSLGPGPWLRVRGRPLGARVNLDGNPAGVLPLRTAVPPGTHQLRVSAPGHRPVHRSVAVPLDATHEARVQVALERRVDAPHPHPAVPSSPRGGFPYNAAVSGALATAGALALISPLYTWARHGDCRRTQGGACTVQHDAEGPYVERYRAGSQTAVWVATAALLFGAAATIGLVAPFTSERGDVKEAR